MVIDLCRYISSDCDSVDVLYNNQHYTKTPEDAAAISIKAGTMPNRQRPRSFMLVLCYDNSSPFRRRLHTCADFRQGWT